MNDTAKQHWNAQRYAQSAGFVAELGLPVLDWLDPKPGERILDLGCGEGKLTEQLAKLGCDVIGIDSSTEQIAATVARGLTAEVASATDLPFNQEFDAVFSNAVLHWIKDADAAILNVKRSLKPGGRFVAELGGAGNIAAVMDAIRSACVKFSVDFDALNPWHYPSVEEYSQKLTSAGFSIERIELFERPTPLSSDIADWVETLGNVFLNAVVPGQRVAFLKKTNEAAREKLQNPDGSWWADYVRLRFVATLMP